MLRELVQLWPGGPSLTLGGYFVAFKYWFTALFLVWALGALRWPTRRYLLGGVLFLALSSALAFAQPLGRPYGLVEESRGLEELGEAMVVVARGDASEGRLVGEPNANAAFGLALALFSGLDPERAWRLYGFLPLLVLLALGLSVAWALSGLEEGESLPEGTLPFLGAFFVLFLSSHRLSFLQPTGAFWPEYVSLTPRIGAALALLAVCTRLLYGGSTLSLAAASLGLALLGWLEPRLALVLAMGALVWIASAPRDRLRRGASVALGLALFVPFRPLPDAAPLPLDWSWDDAVNGLLSVTVDFGLVFVLAALAVVLLAQSDRRPERLLAASTLAALGFFAVALFVPRVAATLDPRILDAHVRLSLSMAAAYGLHRNLSGLGELFPRLPDEWKVPPALRSVPTARLALAAFLVLSLPWCFPYWWEPIRMDPVYVASYPPISRRVLAMNGAIREKTSEDAVFVAGPSYAPWIPALSGRRVLLLNAPAPRMAERRQAEAWFASSNDPERIAAAAQAWDLTHLAWGRLDLVEGEEEEAPDLAVDFAFFEESGLFEEIYRLQRWVRIFEYRPGR